MVQQTVTVQVETGVHARPAAMFVKLANQFSSEIHVEKEGTQINGKSIMGLMMLTLTKGSKITISATGNDEEKALSNLVELIKSDFSRRDIL